MHLEDYRKSVPKPKAVTSMPISAEYQRSKVSKEVQEKVRKLNANCEFDNELLPVPAWFQPLCCSDCWRSVPATVHDQATTISKETQDFTSAKRESQPKAHIPKAAVKPQPEANRDISAPMKELPKVTPKVEFSKPKEADAKQIESAALKQFWSNAFDQVDLSPNLKFLSRDQLRFRVRGEKITVGSGCFGTVELGEYFSEKSSVVVAIKELRRDAGAAYHHSFMFDLYTEGQVLHHLQDSGVTPQFYGFHWNEDTKSLSLVEEFIDHSKTLLAILLECPEVVDKAQWRVICLCLAAGLMQIHDSGVLINDIKCDNILVEVGDGEVLPKIRFIDFGNASYKKGRIFEIPPEQDLDTTCFPPEVVHYNHPTSPSSDIFSMGLILDDIACYAGVEDLDDIIDACLAENPNDRPTASELLQLLISVPPF